MVQLADSLALIAELLGAALNHIFSLALENAYKARATQATLKVTQHTHIHVDMLCVVVQTSNYPCANLSPVCAHSSASKLTTTLPST